MGRGGGSTLRRHGVGGINFDDERMVGGGQYVMVLISISRRKLKGGGWGVAGVVTTTTRVGVKMGVGGG
ncbi:hypothetical protein Phum_PHUM401120 [Pediculus humanus corporis]|uniref:Uncharacterized protein n=1 Tax=Pediculus humanus subsp. corporis TaxID=121224 RepID=E0VRQ0_PEDHC|nr:uncharacterized protein Phum_PHUM401120 [Pediculus humanus corporis]EEB16056.1 hypothetical protein Phum_PHUM401120 [Pediculus humanus corporis]